MKTISNILNIRNDQNTQLLLSSLSVGCCLLLCSFKIDIALLLAIFYAVCSYTRPHWAIYLLVILTPIARLPGLNDYIEPIVLSMIFISCSTWIIKRKGLIEGYNWPFFEFKEFNLFMVLFISTMAISLLASVNVQNSLRIVVMHLAGFLSLYCFLDVLQEKNYLRNAVYLFIGISLGVSLLACLQYAIMKFHILMSLERLVIPAVHRLSLFENDTGDDLEGGYRSVGTFFHPNNLGAYLALSVPVLMSLLNCVKSTKQRIVICIIGFFILTGIVCSGSRGAMINVCISSLLLLLVFWKKISPKFKIWTAILGVAFLIKFSDRIITFLRFSDGVSNRDVIWHHTLQLISEHPIVGHGMGTFSQEFFSRFGFPSVEDLKTILNEILITGESNVFLGIHAHNLFLNYAFELGILGSLLIVFFFICYLRAFIKFLSKTGNDQSFNFSVAVGCTGSVIGQFIHNFFETSCFNYIPFSYSFILVVAVGIILMHKKYA